MPLRVNKLDVEVKDPQSGQMIPGGLLGSDSQQIKSAIYDWMEDHPDDRVLIDDGSITEVKFADALKLKTIKDYVTPEMFGAVGDGETDDHDAIVNAANYAYNNGLSLWFPENKTYYTESSIQISNVPKQFIMDGIIQYNNPGIALTLGKLGEENDSSQSNLEISVKVKRGGGNRQNTDCGCRILNISNSTIKLKYIRDFYYGVRIDSETADNEGSKVNNANICTAYNTFYIGYISGCAIGIQIYSAAYKNNSVLYGAGWVNENKFFSGRIAQYTSNPWAQNSIGVKITSATPPSGNDADHYYSNHNIFYATCMEGLTNCVYIEYGAYNCFLNIRSENTGLQTENPVRGIVVNQGTNNIFESTNDLGDTYNHAEGANLYISASEYITTKYNKLLFDSGRLADKYAANSTEIYIKSCCELSRYNLLADDVTPENICLNTAKDAIKVTYNNLNAQRCKIGTRINTKYNKSIMIIPRFKVFSGSIRLFISCYGNNGTRLTPNTSKVTCGILSSATHVPVTIASNAYYYVSMTAAMNNKPIFFKLDDECASAWVGFYSASSTAYEIESFEIYGKQSEAKTEFQSREYLIMDSSPTAESVVNTIVYKSAPTGAGNVGWIYNGSSWVAF